MEELRNNDVEIIIEEVPAEVEETTTDKDSGNGALVLAVGALALVGAVTVGKKAVKAGKSVWSKIKAKKQNEEEVEDEDFDEYCGDGEKVVEGNFKEETEDEE